MSMITFVTSSSNKLVEAQAILPFQITSKALDLLEIQSLDIEEIVNHKLRDAYERVGGPVMVEDVSAEIESLHGLPGPFIKFFEQKLGADALYKLSKTKNDRVKIICCIGYYEGKKRLTVQGVLQGQLVAPRGNNGWGFDKVIVPDGYSQTMAEMTDNEKNKFSHRYLALTQLANRLEL